MSDIPSTNLPDEKRKTAVIIAHRLIEAGYIEYEVAKSLNPVETVANLIEDALSKKLTRKEMKRNENT